jgi:PAS domain S-box-containing protein
MLTIRPDDILLTGDQTFDTTIKNQSLQIVKTDEQGRFTYLNRLFCEATGIRDTDYIGKHYLELVLPEDHELCRSVFRECLQAPAVMQRVLLRKHTDSGIAGVQWEFIRLDDAAQHFKEILCIGHDVTPLVRQQEILQGLVATTSRQNERLKDFTYIISHNIRSHVANLSGIIDNVDLDDKQDAAYSLELLKISVGALDNTIRHLNEVISIQSENNLPLAALNVTDEVHKVVDLLRQPVQEARAEIQLDLGSAETLETNPAYLESILLNILSNALKYRDPDRQLKIRLTLYEQAQFKVIKVSDNGIGIDLARNMDKLFKMFGTFNGNRDARGLGLFIVKTQVEALGGKITVDSEPGEGSTFSVYFPTPA